MPEIQVIAHPDYIEWLARQIWTQSGPWWTATLNTEGVITTGPTQMTWETESEERRDRCRKKAISIISGQK